MRDYLNDIIQHTCNLGVIELIKIVGTNKDTAIRAVSEDRTIIMNAKFKAVNSDFEGVFGMPNLPKLKTILGFDEYDDKATIVMTKQNRDGTDVPVAIHFETAAGDFVNDYRLMGQTLVEEKVKDVKFNGASWNVDFEPKVTSIQRMKKQSQANSEEQNFAVKTENNNLKVYFGNVSSHSGNFVFESSVSGKLSKGWCWPVKQFLSIVDLPGDKHVYISDQGAMRITVDSGLIDYEYLLPAQN
jgi:hypothetical protein